MQIYHAPSTSKTGKKNTCITSRRRSIKKNSRDSRGRDIYEFKVSQAAVNLSSGNFKNMSHTICYSKQHQIHVPDFTSLHFVKSVV
jgi:hypothetical protein